MNMREVLDTLEIPYLEAGQHEHCREGWVNADCPSCGLTGHWRLGINLNFNYTHCWSCGPVRLIPALTELANTSGTHRTVAAVYELVKGLIPTKTDLRSAGGHLERPGGISGLLKPHLEFLRSRGFDPEAIVQYWNVQGIGMSTKLSWSLYIPVLFDGKELTYVCRRIASEGPKYLTCPLEKSVVGKSKLLYGEDKATHTVACVEGPLDVWALGPGGVATLGVGYSRTQAKRLARFPNRIICFDAEPKAQERARKLCSLLEAFPGKTTRVELASGKDASRCAKWELKELRSMLK